MPTASDIHFLSAIVRLDAAPAHIPEMPTGFYNVVGLGVDTRHIDYPAAKGWDTVKADNSYYAIVVGDGGAVYALRGSDALTIYRPVTERDCPSCTESFAGVGADDWEYCPCCGERLDGTDDDDNW